MNSSGEHPGDLAIDDPGLAQPDHRHHRPEQQAAQVVGLAHVAGGAAGERGQRRSSRRRPAAAPAPGSGRSRCWRCRRPPGRCRRRETRRLPSPARATQAPIASTSRAASERAGRRERERPGRAGEDRGAERRQDQDRDRGEHGQRPARARPGVLRQPGAQHQQEAAPADEGRGLVEEGRRGRDVEGDQGRKRRSRGRPARRDASQGRRSRRRALEHAARRRDGSHRRPSSEEAVERQVAEQVAARCRGPRPRARAPSPAGSGRSLVGLHLGAVGCRISSALLGVVLEQRRDRPGSLERPAPGTGRRAARRSAAGRCRCPPDALNIASLRSAPVAGRRAPSSRGPVSGRLRYSGRALGSSSTSTSLADDQAEAVDLEHHRDRPGDVDGVQAVDQGGDLQHADHRQVAPQVPPALGAVEDGEGQQRTEHHVDAGDQQEQVAAAGQCAERARSTRRRTPGRRRARRRQRRSGDGCPRHRRAGAGQGASASGRSVEGVGSGARQRANEKGAEAPFHRGWRRASAAFGGRVLRRQRAEGDDDEAPVGRDLRAGAGAAPVERAGDARAPGRRSARSASAPASCSAPPSAGRQPRWRSSS